MNKQHIPNLEFLRLDLNCSISLFEEDEQDFDFLIENWYGKLMIDETEIGEVKFYRLRPDCFQDLAEACDEHSQELADLWEECAPELGDCAGEGIMLIHKIELKSEYRGAGAGLEIMREICVRFGAGHSFVACKPFPLDMDIQSPDFKAKQSKLRRYWTKAHFQRIRRTNFFIWKGCRFYAREHFREKD